MDSLAEAVEAFQAGDVETARSICARLVANEADRPQDPEMLGHAHNLLGVIALGTDEPSVAADQLHLAVSLQPDARQFQINLASALIACAEWAEAAVLLERIIEADPDLAFAHSQLAHARRVLGDTSAASDAMLRAAELDPENVETLNNLSVMLLELDDAERARQFAQRAVALGPDLAQAHYNLSVALRELERFEEATARCRRALDLDPDYWEAHNNLGCLLLELDGRDEAIEVLERATQLAPGEADPWRNLGKALRPTGRLYDAAQAYEKSLACNPEDEALCAELEYLYRGLCDWSDEAAALRSRLETVNANALAEGRRPPEHPHAHLTRSTDAVLNLDIARAWSAQAAEEVRALGPPAAPPSERPSNERIRLGYLSNLFRDHAASHLMLGMFARHDRSRFEVNAYSYGPETGDAYHERIAQDCDRFVHVADLNDREVALRMIEDSIDILIDLRGHGTGNRFGIVAQRIAPVQVHFLGYPGTTGAPTIDYFIADPFVCPPEDRSHFSEAIVLMPDSYQINDDQQEIAQETPSRADFGIPPDGTLFCAFNGYYKIMPPLFGLWTDILRAVPGSTLWLYGDRPETEANLKRAASQAGVEPERLVFSNQVPKAEHLARLQLADLALDSHPCNGHTTTSDALWAGVPVLTMKGQHFASRVSESLLQTIGLPELVAADAKSYVAQAIAIARDPSQLAALRSTLVANRETAALFDTARFVGNLEKAYLEMWRRLEAGEAPSLLDVRTLD